MKVKLYIVRSGVGGGGALLWGIKIDFFTKPFFYKNTGESF
jgi:hypothetical protein